jgi:protein disulfide-isomerase
MQKMGKVRRGLIAFVGVLALQSAAAAQQTTHWETSIDTAKRMAAQSNRFVLIVFSAPWCTACRAMENDVLGDPAVVAALSASYVPAKLNVDYYRGTAGQYGVSILPTTVILAPGGRQEVLDVIRGRLPADQFSARLNQVVANFRQRPGTVYTQIAGGPAAGGAAAVAVSPGPVALAPVAVGPGNAAAPASAPATAPAAEAAANGLVAAAVQPPAGLAGLPPASESPTAAAGPPTADAVHNPPLGLDGFCPVQLAEKAAWSRGDERWGAVHRGRTYLFVGPEEQHRFLLDADRYAPVNSGDDVVVALEQGRTVPGLREHGVSFGGRIYLFADEVTLEKFTKNPRYYADRAIQAMRSEVRPGPQVR